MVDIPLSLAQYSFGIADGVAAPSTPAALIPAPMPDAVDVAAIPALKAGAVVGLTLAGNPASGDTVQVFVYKNGSQVATLTLTITNAAPNAVSMFSKDTPAFQFVAGDLLGVRYLTTTGGTYTARDVLCIVAVQYGLSE